MVVRELITKLGFNTDTANLNKYEQGIERVKGGVNSLGNSLSGIGTIVKIVGGAIATAGIFSLGKSILDTVGEVEQYRVTLGTMIGDQEKANKIIHDLDYSPVSDFYGTVNAIGGLQGLVTFGMQAEDASDTLTRLGDIAQGNSEAFKSLSLNMGQVFAKGKADAMDIKQFVTQGFDVIGVVAEITGKSREEIEKAGVTYEQTAMALKYVTDEGGKYNGMLKKQSQTIPGLIKQFSSLSAAIKEAIGQNISNNVKSLFSHLLESGKNLQDNIVEIGSKVFGTITKAITKVIAGVELLAIRTNNFEGIRKLIEGVAKAFKTVGEIVFNVFMKITPFINEVASLISKIFSFIEVHKETIIKIASTVIPIILKIIIGIKTLTIVIGALNAIMTIFNIICSINPLTLIIMGIIVLVGLLIAGIYKIVKNWDKVKEAFNKFFTWVKDGFRKIGEKIKNIWNEIKNFFIGLWESIKRIFFSTIDWIVNLWYSIVDFFKGLWENIKKIFFNFIEWVSNVFSEPIEAIKNAWNGIIDFFKGLWNKVFGIFTSFGDKIKSFWNGITSFFGFGDNEVEVNKNITATQKELEGSAGSYNNYTSSIINSSNPSTVNSNSTININVPPGTTQQQSEEISRQVQSELERSWKNILDRSRGSIPTPEARGF